MKIDKTRVVSAKAGNLSDSEEPIRQRSVKSADRALEVFELFAELKRPIAMREIVANLGYPQSSANYLLKGLCDRGYLNFNKVGHTYFPTAKLRSLGSWIEGHLPENTAVYDAMRALRAKFGETVAVGTQSDVHLQYLKAIESDYVVRYHIAEGDRRPLLEASMGLMLISQYNDGYLESICLRTNQLLGHKRFKTKEILAKVAEIRKLGYCFLEDRTTPYHAATIAMFLPLQYNGQPLVIGLGGVFDRIHKRRDAIVKTMRIELSKL